MPAALAVAFAAALQELSCAKFPAGGTCFYKLECLCLMAAMWSSARNRWLHCLKCHRGELS